jgi:hypothetical protein
MREIELRIFQIDDDINKLKEEIKILVNEPVFDTFRIIELCTAINHGMTVAVILGEVVEKEKVKTVSSYN